MLLLTRHQVMSTSQEERVGIGATCEYTFAILIGDVSDGRLDVGTWTYSDSANDQLNGVLEVDVNPVQHTLELSAEQTRLTVGQVTRMTATFTLTGDRPFLIQMPTMAIELPEELAVSGLPRFANSCPHLSGEGRPGSKTVSLVGTQTFGEYEQRCTVEFDVVATRSGLGRIRRPELQFAVSESSTRTALGVHLILNFRFLGTEFRWPLQS